MFKTLLPFIKKYKVTTILCPVMVLLEVVADVLMPVLMARIVDQGIQSRNIQFIVENGLLMIGLALFGLFCGAFSNRLAAISAQGFGAELRLAFFGKVQDFSFANLDRFSIPSLITRQTSDINNLQTAIMMGLRMLVRAPFMMVLALVMAFMINQSLAIVFVIAIPILALLLGVVMVMAYPRFQKLQKMVDNLNTSVQENLISIRVVKAFVRGEHEKARFRKANDELKKSAIHAIQLVMLNMPGMQLIMYGCILAILWLGGNLITAGQLKTGELISFITYVNQILNSLLMLSMVFLMLTRAKASAERIVEVLETKIDLLSPADGLKTIADGSIDFNHVDFAYPSGSVGNTLSDLNLSIASGEIIGIIGSTGSGKSSMVQLIPRLYDASSGQVRVGGFDVRQYDLKTLRDAVAMVLQKNTLFSGSVRENLLWGNPQATEADLREACEAAQAWSFIAEMPQGLDTLLGQGGVNLSGGQKQRLCIARALLKNPRIIILDDSTSAVDMATDAKIRAAFSSGLRGVTTLIVAQRIRSIAHADRIIVLDNGQINGIGTHDELMASNAIYRDVFESQQEGAIAG